MTQAESDMLLALNVGKDYAKQAAEREARAALYSEKLRTNCAEAIGLLSDAIIHPSCCRQTLQEALCKVALAAASAVILDPED